MQIDGRWLQCDDGIVRPVIWGEILGADDEWARVPFLVDTGADRTVFSASILAALHLKSVPTGDRLGGVGGLAESVDVATRIRLFREDGGEILFRGQYAAFTELDSLDISVLGRDITGLFAVVVDQPGNRVCLLGQRHGYAIVHR